MVSLLHKMGLSSNVLYTMGAASIGASFVSWMVSRGAESTERADRWGIFVGQWAPTFFALGCALRLEEQWAPEHEHHQAQESRERMREAMPTG
ncbi:hypothetical protein DZF91_35080 [Actinomadura logoneensis]|uniref:Uncharacterized protein n=1 Tax=Actinomadura logoneensis TaxID=2293572 RepID=A0A372JCA8_9ACTN|nr:hypothetical protein [Actinomadura logoneensis]RFU37018.1 hypothetical protein DZF91_35080 [Actinomadura logoneensis]